MGNRFNLSEKRKYTKELEQSWVTTAYLAEDVKEFIKRLEQELKEWYWNKHNGAPAWMIANIIDKLAGDKLVEKGE